MLSVCTATFFLCIKQCTVSPRFVYHKAVERERVRAYVKSQKQAIHVTLKCANNCSGWLVPPVWCHPTDERLLAAVRMYAVLSVNASQRSAFDSLPGGKHIISGREPDLLNFHQLAVIRIHPKVVGFPQPLPFFLSVSHRILFGGFAVFLFLTRRWQRNQGGKLLKNQTQSPFLGAGFVATGHEFGGTDGYMVDHARGAGIAEEDHLGSWSVSPEFLERWGGFVQTVGASQPGVHGESKGINPPPPCSPSAYNQPPAPSARLCAADPWKPTRFAVWLLFLPTGPWGDFPL